MSEKTLEELAQIVRHGLDRPAKDETLAALEEILRRAERSYRGLGKALAFASSNLARKRTAG